MSKMKLASLSTVLSVSAIAALPLSTFTAETITWSSNGTHLRSQVGQTFSFVCPSNGTIHPVKGSVVYADESSVCSAAVHAGKITADRGGAVTRAIDWIVAIASSLPLNYI